MKAMLTAMATAVAVILGITSCAAPAPTTSAVPPASAVAAQMPQARQPDQPMAPAPETAAVPIANTADAEAYRAVYRQLANGNVPHRIWVQVAYPPNADGSKAATYHNRNNSFPEGAHCFIEFGGRFTKDGNVDHAGLYDYVYPFMPANSLCPSGIKFYAPADFDPVSLENEVQATNSVFTQELEIYGSMPDAFSGDTATGTPPFTGSVRVMNLVPLSNRDKTFVFWSGCSLKDKENKFLGKIEILGKTPIGTTFARFITNLTGTGGECPSGTIFVMESSPGPGLMYDDGIDINALR